MLVIFIKDPLRFAELIIVLHVCGIGDTVQLGRGPLIYYVSTCRKGKGLKMAIFAYFQHIKHSYIRGRDLDGGYKA